MATVSYLAVTTDGKGYLILESNGGVDNFGDATWYGSDADNLASDNPATAIARTPDGKGYWILTALGNLDNFGDATWYGGPRASANGGNIGTTAVSITPTPDGKGYWVLGANGHLFAYGDATNSSYSGSLQATGVAVVAAPDVTRTSLTYDGLGQLASQTTAGVTEHFAYDQVAPAPLLLTDGSENDVYTPSGTPIEEVASSATSTSSVAYLLQDGTGSTRLLASSTGSVVAAYAYDAYGNLVTESGTATTPLLFQGQYDDQALGAYDLRARWYDPGSAQFLSVDPLLAVTESPFGYAGGDPVNFSDPTGLDYGPGAPGCNGRLFALGACPQEVAAIQAGSCSLSNFEYYSALFSVVAPFGEAFGALDAADLAAEGAEAAGDGAEAAGEVINTGNVAVYTSRNAAGDVNYVGITNIIARRAAEQFESKGINMDQIPGLGNLSRADARAVEQVLIERYGGPGGGQLLNQINSIAQSNPIYAQSLQRGCDILSAVGYPEDGC